MSFDSMGTSQPPRAQPSILGNSDSTQEVRRLASLAADGDGDVLIVGDTGTGKEHVARAIHEQSARQGPFLCVDGSSPATVLDFELFGPKPPATTLFLRNVADLSLPLQGRLKAAQDHCQRNHGNVKGPLSSVRLVCSTSQDLRALVRRRAFDQELHEKLATFTIHLVPLNSRREDIPILLAHFLRALRQQMDHHVERFSSATEEVLMRRTWKGNVREVYEYVRTTVEVCSAKVIEPMDLWLPRHAEEPGNEPWQLGYRSLRKQVLLQFEADFVAHVLKASSGNVSLAARLAKIDRKHLWRLIQRTGMRLQRVDKTASLERP